MLLSGQRPPGYTGNLASVLDNTTANFVANLTGSHIAWIGGYQNSSGAEEPWHWSDGSVWDYENWRGPGEPNNCCGGEDYLEINFGEKEKWNDFAVAKQPWNYNIGYVCQYKGMDIMVC